jgi:formylglycine-generating enzyme required for sulfatase activity
MGVEASPDFRCLSGRDNDPVVYVSFQDSLKFCAALTDAWRQHLPAGFMVTLPSEAEWEKAARGGKSLPADVSWVGLSQLAETLEKPVPALTRNPFPRRGYAWGESFDADKANVESDIGESSAAGCYPTGDSPYGCEDMCGNVFEWTRSLWGRSYDPEFMYPYSGEDTARENIHADANVRRVVRGGSWDDHRDGARCAFRYWGRPEDRNGLLGFRVVLRSAPVQQL